ncbi:MAG: cell division protein ZapA [Pseudomonadota bacterium]|nr:cell division protein ZapA [Pseudomonadota bacterium]
MNNVELKIFDRSYTLACEAQQADALKAAARYIDSKLREARSAMPRVESERLAVLVALDICQELLMANKALQEHAACQRLIHQMIDDVESCIDAQD